MARARPGTGGAKAPPHLQKGLTRGTRELRREVRNAEGRDYLILRTLIILIRVVTYGRLTKGPGEAPRNGRIKWSGRRLLSEESELSEESSTTGGGAKVPRNAEKD